MADFDIKLLSCEDGSWDAFEADWRRQCGEVDEEYDDYAPDVLNLLSGIVTGKTPTLGGVNVTRVGALWDAQTKRYYAACILNRTMLPGTPGYTLRVRQLIVSPLLDYGVAEVEMYPDVVIGVMLGIVHLSSTVLMANTIHLHLRSPEDMAFFAAFGTALGETKVFASVQRRGAWLYVEKIAAASIAATEEES